MSLRDQLLAKGLVTKKQARKADQEKRRAQKAKKGKKKRKKLLDSEARAATEASQQAKLAEKLAERRARETERERMERALQIRNTAIGNRLRSRGSYVFHHRSLDGTKLLRMCLSERMADQLRRGDAAIIGIDGQYFPITRRGAEKLDDLAPQLLVFWQRDTKTLSRPDQRPVKRDWEPSLNARRATPEDIERLRKPA